MQLVPQPLRRQPLQPNRVFQCALGHCCRRLRPPDLKIQKCLAPNVLPPTWVAPSTASSTDSQPLSEAAASGWVSVAREVHQGIEREPRRAQTV